MRIGVDAMGGDNAPGAVVEGALAARSFLDPGDKIVLVGHEDKILRGLDGSDGWADSIEVRHASQVIDMAETPVESLRAKQDSSIAVVVQMHADGEVDACISAGNTGAFVAAAQMRLRRLQGVHRPGIAILTPTFHGPVAICDVGANVNCRPQHLLQYGLMASVYLEVACGIESPRVGLLSIGAEAAKGNNLVREAGRLMKDHAGLNFLGNVEGRDLFGGVCDVMVCEGFVGNVVLKLIEGMAEGVLRGLLGEFVKSAPDRADEMRQIGGAIMKKYDFNEYGGAPLLGVGGTCLICHGASSWRGIMNAVNGAKQLVSHHVNQRITELLQPDGKAVDA